jgi:integrase
LGIIDIFPNKDYDCIQRQRITEAMKRKSTSNIKYLTEEQLAKLFSVISSPRDRAIFRLAYHRGLRASEVGMLTMNDYRPSAGRIFVHRLKEGHSGEYSLTDIEQRTLRAWLKERGAAPGPIFISRLKTAISQQMLDVLMKAYCEQARIPRDIAHFHSLRHSCATSLLGIGRGIEEVKDHLGHKNIASTDLYAKITNKHRDRLGAEMKGWK